MLSYRHAFHAGNYADVLKHAVQAFVIDYLKQKPKPFVIHDTHAGAGCYALTDAKAEKTGEYRDGIAKVLAAGEAPKALKPYLEVIQALNPGELKVYPGSPWLSRQLMDGNQRLQLTELHPADHKLLCELFKGDRQVRIDKADAFETLIAKLPPRERRGLVVMDPPYEVKDDYQQVVKAIKQAHKRFATGTYLIWYPVVERARTQAMLGGLKDSGIRNQLVMEHGIRPDAPGMGMTAAGVVVINPPWTLKAAFDEALPWLNQVLSPGSGFTRCEWLVEE
ncbi:23S rRNA (adenine(2030)-N(6))-methyltransferase RlmJ [Gallaecimonas sp. GXIMD4217]|uniref:23S rRNA (adenine(2030)-N(6))-methyltransferase RlmJ n=1 Tax=Gallaecimonas sp. GXIMD4217 TaxID=3131927 RepID=UPI00311B23D1